MGSAVPPGAAGPRAALGAGGGGYAGLAGCGGTAVWWGLRREPRRSRAFRTSLVRNARRHRTLLTLPPPAPPQPASPSEARDLRERPGRRPPARPTPPPAPSGQSPAVPTHPSLPTPLPRPARRTSLRDCGSAAHRFGGTPRRRYPVQQAPYSWLGVRPTVCGSSWHRRPVLSARNSKTVRSPVTVRIAPPESKLNRPPLSGQISSSTLSSPSTTGPDPCAKETVLSALRAWKQRTAKEEDQICADGQENKRRRHESSGSGPSAFEPLVASGLPASFVPKPGSLKRGLSPQSSDDHLNKRSRTSPLSSLTSTDTGGFPIASRNAITSSYSSTGGLCQLRKRSAPSSSPFSGPASSCSQTLARPAKRRREQELPHRSGPSTPFIADKESRGAPAADTATWKKQNSRNSPLIPGSSGQRRRKVQLLRSWRGDQLSLPPPPQLGYSVTAEDIDLEKKAWFQWFNEILEDKTDTAWSSVPENPPSRQPPFTFSLPAAGTPATTTTLPAPSPNPLLKSSKKMQDAPGLPSLPTSAGMATTVAQSPPKTPRPLAPLGPSQSGPLPGTSSDSKPTAISFGGTLIPASSTGPVPDTTSPPAPQAETSAKSQALLAPSPTPKHNIPFGMLSTSAAHPPASAAPAVASPSPVLDPMCWPPPKSKNEGALPSSPSKVTATTSSSSALPITTGSPSLTFKPVSHTREAAAPVPTLTPFFKQTAPPASTLRAPLFTGQTSATSAVAPATTAGPSSVDSALKPMFRFCVSSMTSSLSSVTSPTASTAQPFLFGSPSASGASFTPAVGSSSTVQFGKPPTLPPSTAVTSFGASLPSAAQTVAGSSSSTAGDGDVGSTLTASAPATTSQPALTFSRTATPAFNIPFGSSAKPSLSSHPGSKPRPSFGATDGQQQWAAQPSLVPSLCSSFTLGDSAAPVPTATPAAAQPALGSTTQSTLGGLKATASASGTLAGPQPAFGSTTAVFSFGAATTSGLAATTWTTSGGTSSSSSTTPSPFTFGGSAAPAGSRGVGISVASPGTSSASGAFGPGAGRRGTAGSMTPFVGGLSQNSLGAPRQNISFAFKVACTPDSKPVFGGSSTPTFGQSTPARGVGTSGSSLSFGASSTPTQGFVRTGPSFSKGAGSKPPGAWQQLQARRQHTSKK
uniref:Nuclear envelope pore membrane protein POM 121C-like n=1 Tax=Sus scrofa TaxID=9823 RepID=A0A8D0ZED4_PIG